MAVIRQANLLGQQRLDVPHVRAIESAVARDFDVLAGQMLAGEQAVILNGFRLSTSVSGGAATDLKLQVAGGAVMHYNASESGTIFSVPSDRADEELSATNVKVIGSFTANQTNYIGIDFRRTADSTTADLVQFIDPNTGKETSATVPLARTLDYRIYISTTNFDQTSNVCPVAKVVTDASNNVQSIADARQMFFRLGTGGTTPSSAYVYPWAQGRNESASTDAFSGGDKSITSLKEWSDAVMTRLWELGGGEYWYANAADRNVNMIGTGTTFSNGEYFVWTLGSSNLVWKGLRFLFDNSAANYNIVQDNATTGVTLADGECLYVDLNRSNNGATVTPVKGTLATLGTSTIPGNRYVIAWRNGDSVYTRGWRYAVGTTFTPATTTSTGVVQLNNTPGSATNPRVVSIMSNGQAEVTATASDSHGIRGTGHGTGPGISAVGGSGGNALATLSGQYNHDHTGIWATVTRYGATTSAPALFSRKSRNATIGGNTIVQNGDTLMALIAQGANGSSYITAAQITAEVDGAPSSTSNDMPGRLVFSTTADNATGSVPTERMRIGSNGGIGVTGLLNNNSTRPSIAAATNSNEIRAISTTSAASDDGFLRISAGGGTTATAKSYIDLSGFSNQSDMLQNIVLGTSGVERLRISSTGSMLQTYPSLAAPSVTWGGTAGQILRNENAEIAFGHNAAPGPYYLWMQGRRSTGVANEIVLQPSGGNVGIGVFPTQQGLHVGANANNWIVSQASGTGTIPLFVSYKSNGTIAAPSSVVAGDELGRFDARGYIDGTPAGYRQGASINAYCEANPTAGTNNVASYLAFATSPGGATSPQERMRINSSGNVTINAPVSGNALTVTGVVASTNNLYAETGGNAVSSAYRIRPPAWGMLNNSQFGNSVSVVAPPGTPPRVPFGGASFANSLNMTATATSGSEGFTAIPAGTYQMSLQGLFQLAVPGFTSGGAYTFTFYGTYFSLFGATNATGTPASAWNAYAYRTTAGNWATSDVGHISTTVPITFTSTGSLYVVVSGPVNTSHTVTFFTTFSLNRLN